MRGEIDVVTMGSFRRRHERHRGRDQSALSGERLGAAQFAAEVHPQVVCRTAAETRGGQLSDFFAPADGGNPSPQRCITFVEDRRHDDEALIAAVGIDDVQYAIVEEDTFNASRHFRTTMRNARSLSSRRYRASGCCTWDMKLRDEAEAFHTHHA